MSEQIVTVGRGPHKVIALHGWFGSAQCWEPLIGTLDEIGFSYALLDYRGYGARKHVAGQYTLNEIAEDVLSAANELGWETFSLIGHSMGGAAMQHAALAQPKRVRSMVGITPVPASGVPFDEQAWGMFASAAGDATARRGILDFSTGNRLSGYWLDRMVRQSFDRSSREAFAAYLSAWAKVDISKQVRGLDMPVHVIVGEQDAGLNEDFVRQTWLTDYPKAGIEVLRNAGHYPMDETPVALVTSIERFLCGLP